MTTPSSKPTPPPRILAGRYELSEHIDSGLLTTVWKAWDTVLARPVAVKILRKEYVEEPEVRARFKAEAIAAARLVHPGIVAIFDTGSDGDDEYVVMEWMDGRRLDAAIAARKHNPLEIDEVAHIARRISLALAYAHERGMLHGAVHSHNVLLTADGRVKLADFGVSRAVKDSPTPPPEQLRGHPIDERTDLWGLGLILYELLTGENPITARGRLQTRLSDDLPRPSLKRGSIPTELDDLVSLLTASNPDNRPADASRVSQALARFEHARIEPPSPPKRRRFVREVLWVVPVIVLIVAAGWLVQSSKKSVSGQDPAGGGSASEITATNDVITAIVGVDSFDPQGDSRERDHQIDALLDGAPATSWATELYHTADFGGLKDGVGFVLDLGSAKRVSEVELATPHGGFDVHIGVASTPEESLDGFTIVAKQPKVDDDANVIAITPPKLGRYVLVWLTGELPKVSDRYRAEISSVRVRVQP
ncbi:serine/threonine-protein kinase [Stomatohabitans albus]|uniref:serine/threonine-protein kinase n=1 Tax=Stomatohabitans albus TaxID=3110766 RepID=UPI00300D034C